MPPLPRKGIHMYGGSMKRHNKEYLNKIDLPAEVKEGIRSRSSMLSATLRTIPEEDLIQEGLEVVYRIMKGKPDVSIPYLMKAINYHYADIQHKEINRKVIRLQNFTTDTTEKELDKLSYRIFQKGKKKEESKSDYVLQGSNDGLFKSVVALKEKGVTFKQIAEYSGKNVKTIRRILRKYGQKD
jgi:hypothetical protein